jgi:hypothetical protein
LSGCLLSLGNGLLLLSSLVLLGHVFLMT